MAHSGCSEVAMRYLSSPSPASTAMTASQSRVECIAPVFKVPAEPASSSGNAGSFCHHALENKSAAAMCTGVCISMLPLPTGQQKPQPLHHSWMLLGPTRIPQVRACKAAPYGFGKPCFAASPQNSRCCPYKPSCSAGVPCLRVMLPLHFTMWPTRMAALTSCSFMPHKHGKPHFGHKCHVQHDIQAPYDDTAEAASGRR